MEPIALKSYKKSAATDKKSAGGVSDSIKFNDNFLPFALYRHAAAGKAGRDPLNVVARRPIQDLAHEFGKTRTAAAY